MPEVLERVSLRYASRRYDEVSKTFDWAFNLQMRKPYGTQVIQHSQPHAGVRLDRWILNRAICL